MKKILYIALILFGLNSYCQSQEKDITATMVYGFFLQMEANLETIYESEPEVSNEINELKLLRTKNFPNSKKNAYEYLKNETDFINSNKSKIDLIKIEWKKNLLLLSKEEKIKIITNYKKYLSGDMFSPMLENVLSFEYQNQPHKEFLNGYTFTYNTKGHRKAKNAEFSIEIPKSWTAYEGKQPNIIQRFTSDCGNGEYSVCLMTLDPQVYTTEMSKLSFTQIDQIYKDEFTAEFAKKIIDGNFISFKPIRIAGRSGFVVVYERVVEQLDMKIKMIETDFTFHDVSVIHIINCGITSVDLSVDIEEKLNNINSLFYMIVNSIVVPRKNNDIIELKGTENQKIIDVKIGETQLDFIFDTGASISLISKSVIDDLIANGVITKRNFLEKKYIVTADGKNHLVELWNLPNIIIGGKKINDIDFAVMEGNIQPLLGMNIINKLNIYKIDLENNKIYLKN